MTASAFDQSERLHGLDGLRGAALLLGVVLHGALSFFPSQIWIVGDEEKSVWASGLFFVIHLFRMASFFLIAGLFGHMMLKRRGTAGFIRNRLIRIAGPLAAFWGPVMAGIVAVLVWNASLHGLTAADAPPPPTYDWTNIPLTHLWFLWVLLWFYAALVIGQAVVARLDRAGRLGRGLDRLAGGLIGPWGPLVLGAPLALALWLEPNWIAFFGIPTPDAGLVPEASALVGFGLAFGMGVLLDRRRDLLAKIEGWTPVYLGLALGAGTTALMLSGGPTPVLTPMTDPMAKALAAAAFGVATYASMFAVVGLALRFWSGHSAVRRYLADASYWIYIVHLPLVMAAQVVVQDWALVWPIKLGVVVVGVMVVSLASYELMVRHGMMGRWLNGRRVPWRRARPVVPVAHQPPPNSLPTLAAASIRRGQPRRARNHPMTDKSRTPEADLAFMRSIVEGSGRPPMTLAICYLAGGLLYGLQCLFHVGQVIGLIRWPDLANLAFVVGITTAFLAVLTWAILKDRKAGPSNRGPLATRVTNAAFSATGMANAAVVIVFAVGAVRDQDFAVWLYYAAIVFALQAAAWYVAWVLKKKAWMLAVSLGGWVTAVALGVLVRQPMAYLGVCTVALFLLFALPGWLMFRDARAGVRAA